MHKTVVEALLRLSVDEYGSRHEAGGTAAQSRPSISSYEIIASPVTSFESKVMIAKKFQATGSYGWPQSCGRVLILSPRNEMSIFNSVISLVALHIFRPKQKGPDKARVSAEPAKRYSVDKKTSSEGGRRRTKFLQEFMPLVDIIGERRISARRCANDMMKYLVYRSERDTWRKV